MALADRWVPWGSVRLATGSLDDFVKWYQDARATIAILSIAGCFILQGYILIRYPPMPGRDVTSIPSWATGTMMAVVGFYFAGRGNGKKGDDS